jgi:diguanylate cyclase (GGDEF)-like protein
VSESAFPSRPTLAIPVASPAEIARLELFDGVGSDVVTHLITRCMPLQLGAGDTVIRLGEATTTMFVVLSGSLSVHGDDPSLPPLGFVHEGEAVGEIGLLDRRGASATVRAAIPSRVVGIDEETFWELASASHRFSLNLLRMLATRMRAASQRIDDEQRAKRDLELEASTDPLTGLPNRRSMDSMLGHALVRARAQQLPLSVVMLDIDHFKRINDTLGHAAGDAVLRALGDGLRKGVRPSDSIARWGGEEFLLLLPGTRLDGALVVAERTRRAVRDILVPGYPELRITASLGVAGMLPQDDAESLVHRADSALYQAKHAGRDRVEAT